MTDAQKKFVELEQKRKQFLEEFDAALLAVAEETGIGNYFQSDDGVVYKIVTPAGRWVKFDLVSYVRTKHEGEERGNLSSKEAEIAGFKVKQ